MNINFNSFANQAVSIFTERLEVHLTAQQKKILIIFSLAMSFLACCYVLSRCFKAKPLPPFISDDKQHFEARPDGYEWVKGKVNAKRFIESADDLSIVAALAKSAWADPSPLCEANTYLNIEDLVLYASVDQTQAIVTAVANDRFKIRAIFFCLFWKMGKEPESSIWKQKIEIALKSLSLEQLMEILAIRTEYQFHERAIYQQQDHEICRVPVRYFLKWQVDLNLPREFIKACIQFDEYAKFVRSEADKERARGYKLAID